MENTLGAADDGEGHDDEPDFDLGPVDDMREVLGGDGGMLGADEDLRLIPNIVDFPELPPRSPGPGQLSPRAPGQVLCGAVRAGVPKRAPFGLLYAVP